MYLEVVFLNDSRQDNELDTRIGKASAIMRQFYGLSVLKQRFLFSNQFLFLSSPNLMSVR